MSSLVISHPTGLPQAAGHHNESHGLGGGLKTSGVFTEFVPSSHPLSPGLSGHGPWGPPEEESSASVGSRGGSPQPAACRAEAVAAARFWADNLNVQVPRECQQRFEAALGRLIERRCSAAWYPQSPTRGQGFRAVVNSASERRCDPLLVEAAREAGIDQVGGALPTCVMWIDPGRVAAKPDSYDGSVVTQRIF